MQTLTRAWYAELQQWPKKYHAELGSQSWAPAQGVISDPHVLAHWAMNVEDPSFQNSPIPPLYSLFFKPECLFSKSCLLPPRKGVVFAELNVPGIAPAGLSQC